MNVNISLINIKIEIRMDELSLTPSGSLAATCSWIAYPYWLHIIV